MSSCAHGDLARAGKRLRREQMLPEMCAQLAPAGAAGEIACIENTLSGRPIPIRDLQYSAARALREQGGSAVRLPSEGTGRHISIIGGGPAGLAASAVLLEQGHTVTLYEKSAQLGGVPERLIPASRYGGAQAEIEALLTPALPTGRLTLHRNTALGVDRTLTAVRKECDAVLLTAGLWQELSLQSADGVWSGLNFLEQVKRGRAPSPPRRAALLSGGDCAMDAACCLKELGTEQIFILFGGARSDMHWCMEEHWFAQPGVHALFFARPLGYLLNTQGHVTHVRVARMALNEEGVPHDVPEGEYTIAVDMVIEAMGLTIDATLRGALQELNFTSAGLLKTISTDSFHTAINPVFAAGALINGGASVPQCVSEGMRAAQEIDHWLTSP